MVSTKLDPYWYIKPVGDFKERTPMFDISREDVLKGLRRFKRLAKQDFLASNQMEDPVFWQLQAESRRKTYDQLISLVEEEGVEKAYEYSILKHRSVLSRMQQCVKPELKGEQLAYELFLHAIGASKVFSQKMEKSKVSTSR